MVNTAKLSNVRVRFPPSPTGIPHIGNTRTALFNFLFARHHKGAFILRIEDTDRVRLVPGAEEKILEILVWLGLVHDEFYKQSERLALYKEKADELVHKGLAKKDEGAIRFIVPGGETISWIDAIGSKNISFKSDDVEDFIILKSDGFPTYHLANIIDDHAMGISHVIRGDEWISSVPKHVLLYRAFGWQHPTFAHLPVILGPDKTKLSKRHGAQSVLDYREKGYLKEALLNYMALLGWNPGNDREIMDIDTMISLFDLKDANTASPMFDSKKLAWMNGVYIRQLKVDELISNIKYQISKIQIKDKKLSGEALDKVIVLVQTRMKTLTDFEELVLPWFEPSSPELTNEEKVLAKRLVAVFSKVSAWNKETIGEVLQRFREEEKISMKVLYRVFTGKEQGLPMSDMIEIVGKEKVIARLG